MTTLIALLYAVNVGGTGRLPMSDLKRLCEQAGFTAVQTYIASGNVIFDTTGTIAEAKSALEAALLDYAGKPVRAAVRTVPELAAVLAANPYPDGAPNRTVAVFLDHPPPVDALARVSHQVDERVALGVREIYIDFGANMGRSKLKVPAAAGTARNMNTISKLVALAQARLA